MAARPVHNFGEFLPIGNLVKRQGFNGRAGDNQSVKIIIAYIVELAIEPAQIPSFGIARRIACCCHQDHFNLQRRIAEKPRKLDFSIALFWHQIKQKQPQRADILTRCRFLWHHIDLLGIQGFQRWQIIWHPNRHR